MLQIVDDSVFMRTVTLEYLDLLLRVGFDGFVFANVETLAAETESRGDASTPGGQPSGPAASAD
jgi:hypothetical protein